MMEERGFSNKENDAAFVRGKKYGNGFMSTIITS